MQRLGIGWLLKLDFSYGILLTTGRKCFVCHLQVLKETGVYYAGRLVHRACLDRAKLMRFQFH